jgi:RNA polymerase sigma-70 factor, ECF subfamily
MDGLEEDSQLMLRYCAGDMRAFESLYSKHRGTLYRYLLKHVRNAAAANDLFQDVWARIVATRERYEPRAKFATYLFHIAHNCAIDHHRRKRSSLIDPDATDADGNIPETAAPEHQQPLPMAEFAQRQRALHSALAQLPDEQREAFLLYEESGLSVEEIGEATGVGAETAKSRLRYAVAKLKKSLVAAEPTLAAGTVS